MSDLISRQMAIDAINELLKLASETVVIAENPVCVGVESARIAVEQLPSAEPERKTGQWIDYPIADGCIQCSVCGVLRMGEPSNYCPNCGCRMMNEQSIDDKVSELPSEAYYNKNWKSKDGGGA